MVVLEGGGMLSSASNQYLQPDYLSPLPTTLDAKKSPLALLAQTCSQIGADSPSAKALLPAADKGKKPSAHAGDGGRSGTSPAQKADRTRSSPTEASKLAFKPYEANVLTRKGPEERPGSKGPEDGRKSATEAGSRKSTPPAPAEKASSAPPAAEREKSVTPPRGASPIIRSGLEILQGGAAPGKEVPVPGFKPGAGLPGVPGLNNLSALCSGCPPGLDPANPAFRPPFAGGFSHHHAALLSGYPAAGPYVSYARVKTAAGGEALVPVCKDPYCTGCQFSVHNANLVINGAGGGAGAAGACPSGCTQCDHQKYGLAAAAALTMLPPGLPPALSPYAQLNRPYVCSWMVGDAYCGKRFATPDELLQHLRTHTSPGTADAAASASAAAAAASASASVSSLLNSHALYSTAALHRGYPNPPLSPLSAARYHPYSKPGLAAGPLAASPFSAFNPTALGPYYSPYSVYGQRIGAAVHQ